MFSRHYGEKKNKRRKKIIYIKKIREDVFKDMILNVKYILQYTSRVEEKGISLRWKNERKMEGKRRRDFNLMEYWVLRLNFIFIFVKETGQ